jgi:spermidine/putrescine transport system ATP-binding protein
MQGPILELREVSKEFPAHRAVHKVSLQIPRGSFFALLGPSGCGKTTTLRMIAGFETPTSGDILLNGASITDLPPYRRSVNTVFQNYALFPHLNVRENVEFGLRRKGANDLVRRVSSVLEQVRLSGKESRKPSELSGGERQRVALARALVLEPEVLLLDEPLSALDPQLRKQVRGEIKDLQRRAGVTFLFVTHDQEEALSMSDQIAVMHNGEVEQMGSPGEIYQRPRTRFVAEFLGAMNWIDGFGVRPELTRISREPQRRSRRAQVTGTAFLGAQTQVELRLESGEIVRAHVPGAASYVPGDGLAYVTWNPEDELRFNA